MPLVWACSWTYLAYAMSYGLAVRPSIIGAAFVCVERGVWINVLFHKLLHGGTVDGLGLLAPRTSFVPRSLTL